MNFNVMDLEGDFDPDEYDKKMDQMFNDDYYNEGEDEAVKPEFPELDAELDLDPNWDDYKPGAVEYVDDNYTEGEPHCDDDDFIVRKQKKF